MIDPAPIRLAGITFGFHPGSMSWRSDKSPWRIRHSDNQGWYAVNLQTGDVLTTSSQSIRQLRPLLALKIRREQA